MPRRPKWLPYQDILTFEQIVRIAKLTVNLGVDRIHVTGGEPLLRKGCPELIWMLSRITGLKDLSLTTNGSLLDRFGKRLWQAGLRRINISLDTLDKRKFARITHVDCLDRVMAGIHEAERIGFYPVKLNVVVVRGINDDEIIKFAKLACMKPFQVRFIEFMPLDGDRGWDTSKVVSADEIIAQIKRVMQLEEIGKRDDDPARIYQIKGGMGELQIIAPLSYPFCAGCDRVRLSADGKLYWCLFSEKGLDLAALIRDRASDKELTQAILGAAYTKQYGHQIGGGTSNSLHAMYTIGG
jgi:cyclic pyranopterin phosphate synthase